MKQLWWKHILPRKLFSWKDRSFSCGFPCHTPW